MWEGLLVSCLRSDHSPEIHLPRGLDKCCCLLSCLSSPLACTLRRRLPISLTVQPSGARFCKRVSLKAQGWHEGDKGHSKGFDGSKA